MLPIDQVGITSLRLNWTPSTLDAFAAYAIYRSTSSSVSTGSTLVATLTDRETAAWVDTGLEARTQYYYRIYLIDTRDTYSGSDIASATTLGMPVPLAEDFESEQPGWTFTGQWQRQPGSGIDGGTALVDSPGDYLAGTDSHAKFAVNLNGMTWPVLRFHDRHQLAGNTWGRVEVSTDGSNWSRIVYGITEIREEWRQQVVDLSEWKNQTRVFIRFRLSSDGNRADGWAIDNIAVEEHPVATAYPVFDGFESGLDQWLAGSWTDVADNPYAGSVALQDTVGRRNPPDTPNILTLARELDLTDAVDPVLTYFVRGVLRNYSYFRVLLSNDGGLTWATLSSLNLNSGFDSEDWQLQQASLAPWTGQVVRLRFQSSSDYRQPQSDIFLDNIGIGEPHPAAPTASAPVNYESVDMVRPTLVLVNAVDYQSDALNYQFEVYADEQLTQLMAQVPAVASGVATTAWQVDVDLPDNAGYWWRARASDGLHTGPWMPAATFLVNEFNNPPTPVVLLGPSNDAMFLDGDGALVWRQSDDMDFGDEILDYRLQIAGDSGFLDILVDADELVIQPADRNPGEPAYILLSDLVDTDALAPGRWFWRMRARDTRYASGNWSETLAYFRLPDYYTRWLRARYPDPLWLDPAFTGDEADPDGNGVGNLMEFACGIPHGGNPGTALPAGVNLQVGGNLHQGFTWERHLPSDVGFHLEYSSDLKTWGPVPGAGLEVIESLGPDRERVRMVDPQPMQPDGKRFLRLRMQAP